MEEHLAKWFFTLHAFITIQLTLYPCKCCVAIFFSMNKQLNSLYLCFTAIVQTEKMEKKAPAGIFDVY